MEKMHKYNEQFNNLKNFIMKLVESSKLSACLRQPMQISLQFQINMVIMIVNPITHF
jgi:hypothetical protein